LRWQGFEIQMFNKLQKMNRNTNVEGLQVSPAIAKPLLSDAVFRPMLFSTPMVQAIFKGTKKQTRRIIKDVFTKDTFQDVILKNKFKVGDIIWCRETFQQRSSKAEEMGFEKYYFKASFEGCTEAGWKPSLFMPKDACRLFLQITNIEVEKVQNINEEDAINEGLETSIVKSSIFQTYLGYKNYYVQDAEDELYYRSPIDSYKSLWMSINGSQSWQENPFVWVYTFKVVECPHGFINLDRFFCVW
jgi:hypothetical protein